LVDWIFSIAHPFLMNNIDISPSVPLQLSRKDKLTIKNITFGSYYGWSEQLNLFKEIKDEIELLDEYLIAAKNR
jgi:hypothetical protein